MTVAGVGVGGGKREVVVGQTVGGVIVCLSRDLERRAQHSSLYFLKTTATERGFETGEEERHKQKKKANYKSPR